MGAFLFFPPPLSCFHPEIPPGNLTPASQMSARVPCLLPAAALPAVRRSPSSAGQKTGLPSPPCPRDGAVPGASRHGSAAIFFPGAGVGRQRQASPPRCRGRIRQGRTRQPASGHRLRHLLPGPCQAALWHSRDTGGPGKALSLSARRLGRAQGFSRGAPSPLAASRQPRTPPLRLAGGHRKPSSAQGAPSPNVTGAAVPEDGWPRGHGQGVRRGRGWLT